MTEISWSRQARDDFLGAAPVAGQFGALQQMVAAHGVGQDAIVEEVNEGRPVRHFRQARIIPHEPSAATQTDAAGRRRGDAAERRLHNLDIQKPHHRHLEDIDFFVDVHLRRDLFDGHAFGPFK